MAGHRDYSGTPLPAKLGIKAGHTVAFVGEPEGFRAALGPLPPGVEIRASRGAPRGGMLDVVVLFADSLAKLNRRFPQLTDRLAPAGGLWVAWPKKASRFPTDLSFEKVQRTGLEAGLVDNKSCSIDATWQALRFVVRVGDRAGRRPKARPAER